MGKQRTSNKVIVETILATNMSQTTAAQYFNVSTRWIRELMSRYQKGGLQALEPQSKRPHTNPRQTPPQTIKRILQLRDDLAQRGFDNGAQSIQYRLEREHTTPLPAVSTIHRILTKHGRVTPQPRKRPRSSWIRFEAEQPNETWQLDFSHWPLKSGRSAPILTIIDDHTRYILACKAFDYETVTNVIDTFITAGNTHGFPKSTLTDNGSVFTTKLHRKTDTRNGFEQLLLQMGILQKNGTPYHPQTQGKVERFHYTLKLRLKSIPPPHNIGELNHELTAYINEYNTERPHRSLNRRTPHEVYNFIAKAQPLDIPISADNRLRRDKVGNEGKVTLRYKGKLKKLYIGRKHGGKEVILICLDKNITAVDPHNGEIGLKDKTCCFAACRYKGQIMLVGASVLGLF